ncbi:phosphorothioated DNA-binding restriction endonuclease [Actinoplanes sp. NPDC024001]|uniref:phosphorothioated DNA-binding restriction endonuclease n=1 Tax=Actinoplanes sp. NPDC024001 TaxID=3154598 RepID=UPI0033C687CF
MTTDRRNDRDAVLARLATLRQHQRDGRRSPHKPLLVLLALGRLAGTGSSDLPWHEARTRLGALIDEFGPASTTSTTQSAAYPFTRLRSDRIWVLDQDTPMDAIGPLTAQRVTGRFAPDVERVLTAEPGLVASAARALVTSHFSDTVAPDVLMAVGLDPDIVLHARDALPDPSGLADRQRDAAWRRRILQEWDRQCAFCGFDGQLLGATVGVEAAHVRWFNLGGPDELDNGIALCGLHHKLFDRGVLGLGTDRTIHVSESYSARTPAGKAVYDLHGRPVHGRPGLTFPAERHLAWHRTQVFKGRPLAQAGS